MKKGTTVSHFEILDVLGRGGMGVVYRARDLDLERKVALKFLGQAFVADPSARSRFLVEARTASALDHNNICTIHEIGHTDDDQMFICMSLYEGLDLSQKIQRGPLPLGEAISIALQICRGLAAAHNAGIVHRDLKPANAFLTDRGEVKLLDFGLALLTDGARLTKDGITPGTAAYMSPEQAQGGEIDGRSDLWALGVILQEMLTGRLPFRGDRASAVVYSVIHEEPDHLLSHRPEATAIEPIVNRLLSKDPNDRFKSAEEVEAALLPLRREMDSGMVTEFASTPTRKISRRRSMKRLLAAGIAVLVGAIVILGFMLLGDLKSPQGEDHEIARTLALQVHVPDDSEQLSGVGTESAKAADLYLRAKDIRSKQEGPGTADSAEILLRQALEIDPDFPQARAALSECLVDLYGLSKDSAQLEEAEVLANSALAMDPELPAAHLSMARVFSATGRLQESIDSLRSLAALHPELDEAHLRLAVAYEEFGDLARAESSLRQAVGIRPEYWSHWNQLGSLLMSQGEYATAAQSFKKAIELAPEDTSWPQENLATLELIHGDYEAAIAAFDQIPRPINDAFQASNIGTAYYYAERLDQAEEYYRLAVRLRPREASFRANLADLLQRLDNPEGAQREYSQAATLVADELEVNPDREDLQLSRSLYLAKANECTVAMEIAHEIDHSTARTVSRDYTLAKTYAVCNEAAAALESLRQAVEGGYPTERILMDDEFRKLANDPAFRKLIDSRQRTG